MEEEQERLTSSLMAMTSHYAKVQLRLQQIVAAPADSREQLLKDLEEFAFRGIPDVSSRPPDVPLLDKEGGPDGGGGAAAAGGGGIVEEQRRRQAEVMEQLRGRLEELESYAYQSGEADAPPARLLLDRQRVVMEQLKARLDLNVEDLVRLSDDELKAEVDQALGQIVNPLRMKSQLVSQLQTQITDLEMFIQFLQKESSVVVPDDDDCCGCGKHVAAGGAGGWAHQQHSRHHHHHHKAGGRRGHGGQGKGGGLYGSSINRTTLKVLKRALEVLQANAVVVTLGCGGVTSSASFRKNTLKTAPTGAHFGDLRARLEMAVDRALDVCSQADTRAPEEGRPPLAEDQDIEYLARSPRVTAVVRKELAVAVRDLIHHGLCQGGGAAGAVRSLLPFSGCMSAGGRRPRVGGGPIVHAWDVVLRFYEMKGGAEYNAAPQRKLSRSFGLDVLGGGGGGVGPVSNKQALLHTVGQIVATHAPYKRSPNTMFKELVSVALNRGKLVPWLRLVLYNQTVLETMYQPWSYALTSGFDDMFRLLDRLSLYVFDLPVNLGVRQFEDMDEAF